MIVYFWLGIWIDIFPLKIQIGLLSNPSLSFILDIWHHVSLHMENYISKNVLLIIGSSDFQKAFQRFSNRKLKKLNSHGTSSSILKGQTDG